MSLRRQQVRKAKMTSLPLKEPGGQPSCPGVALLRWGSAPPAHTSGRLSPQPARHARKTMCKTNTTCFLRMASTKTAVVKMLKWKEGEEGASLLPEPSVTPTARRMAGGHRSCTRPLLSNTKRDQTPGYSTSWQWGLSIPSEHSL